MTSLFVQYVVGNLVLMLNSYLCIHYCALLVLSEAVCCVEVFTELSHHVIVLFRRGHRILSTKFSTVCYPDT